VGKKKKHAPFRPGGVGQKKLKTQNYVVEEKKKNPSTEKKEKTRGTCLRKFGGGGRT